jgi:hypothetical protein
MKPRYWIALTTIAGSLALPQTCRADLEGVVEPSLEWLVDSSDAIILGEPAKGMPAGDFRVARVLKAHKKMQPGQIVRPFAQVNGDRVVVFLREKTGELLAFNYVDCATDRLWFPEDGDPDESPQRWKKFLAIDKKGEIISDWDELLRRIERRVRAGSLVPPDCDRKAVEKEKSCKGGFRLDVHTSCTFGEASKDGKTVAKNWDVSIDVIVPPDPEFEKPLRAQAADYSSRGHLDAQRRLLANYSRAKWEYPRNPRPDIDGALRLARAATAKGMGVFYYESVGSSDSLWTQLPTSWYYLSPRGRFLLVNAGNAENEMLIVRVSSAEIVRRVTYAGCGRCYRNAAGEIVRIVSSAGVGMDYDFSPDERYFAWKSADDKVSVLDIQQNKVWYVPAALCDLGFSSDGRMLLVLFTKGWDGYTLSAWATDSGKRLFQTKVFDDVSRGSLARVGPALSAIILEGTGDRPDIRLIDAKSGKPSGVIPCDTRPAHIVLSGDGRRIAYALEIPGETKGKTASPPTADLVVRDTKNTAILKKVRLPALPDSLEFLANGESILCVFGDGRGLVFSLDDDRQLGDEVILLR